MTNEQPTGLLPADHPAVALGRLVAMLLGAIGCVIFAATGSAWFSALLGFCAGINFPTMLEDAAKVRKHFRG